MMMTIYIIVFAVASVVISIATTIYCNHINKHKREIKHGIPKLYEKYRSFIDVMVEGFPMDNIHFTDAFIYDRKNEFYIIADFVNCKISHEFYAIARKIWENMFIDVDVIFIEENELNREFLPADIVHIEINQK